MRLLLRAPAVAVATFSGLSKSCSSGISAVTAKADNEYAARLRDAVTTRFLDTNEFSLTDVPPEGAPDHRRSHDRPPGSEAQS